MTIPDGTPMDEDRRLFRDATARLLNAAKGVRRASDDSSVLWGLSGHACKALALRINKASEDLEKHVEALQDFRESVL